MLILSRRAAESICLGDDIVLTIVAVGNDRVRIGVKAPPEVRVLRNELEIQDETLHFEEHEVAVSKAAVAEDQKSASQVSRGNNVSSLAPLNPANWENSRKAA